MNFSTCKLLERAMFILLLVLLMTGGSSCKVIDRDEVPPPIFMPIDDVENASSAVGTVSDDLGSIASSIGIATNSIEKKDPQRVMAPEVRTLRTEVPRIENSRNELQGVRSSLAATATALEGARSSIENLEALREQDARSLEDSAEQLEEARQEAVDYQSVANKTNRRLLTLTSMFGAVCIAICAMLMFNGKGGIGLGVFGIFLIISATAASFIMSHAWISGIAAFIAIGLIVYKALELYKAKRGNRELVATTEKIKKYLPSDAKAVEFGDLVGDGQVGAMQSESTKEIVAQERSRMAGRVRPTIPTEDAPAAS